MKQTPSSNSMHKTPRLILREWKMSDWRDAFEYSRLEKTCRFMPWGPNNALQTKEFLCHAIALNKQKQRTSYEFAIVLQSNNRLIGGCGIRLKDTNQAVGDMGYCLHPNYWGHGYGTETGKELLQIGFRCLHAHRIWATCDIRNVKSENILKKMGMKKEGVLREHLFVRGRWRSSFLYSILASEIKNPSLKRNL
jgi:RimJ/RimL family protein N-acetyltransferase